MCVYVSVCVRVCVCVCVQVCEFVSVYGWDCCVSEWVVCVSGSVSVVGLCVSG